MLSGLLSAAISLAFAEPLAAYVGPGTAPLASVADAAIDKMPPPVAHWAIRTFGSHDKTVLAVGACIVIALFGALAGRLALRRLGYGHGVIAVFGAIGTFAAVTRADATPAAAFPTLVGTGAGAVALLVLIDRLPPSPSTAGPAGVGGTAGPAAPPDPGRRRFLLSAAAVAGIAVVVGGAGELIARWRGVADERAAIRLPAPASPAEPLPVGSDLKLPGLSPFTTPNHDFYRIDTAFVVPQVSPASYKLRIGGRVRNPITLTYEQLLRRPMIERDITISCVSNEVGGNLTGSARWLGVPLRDLLDEAEPEDGADQVIGRSSDGFTAGAPTAVCRDGRDAMLAVGMNGEPLPIVHGFPVRMIVPGLYGYVSATKWLVELELSRFADFDAYWVPRGWSQQGPIKTESRIDTPRSSRSEKAGRVVVAGVAWAEHRGIGRVEVRVDGGSWQRARLAPVPSADTWRQWSWNWDATPGEHRLQVRATDATGATQTQKDAPPAPDGASGWHSMLVTVKG
jgi:DMSO/TMAO reductase YedYZ molybdopterin-dependent catalytic subunit